MTLQKGDWVQVYGQVKKVDQAGVHPEDVLVEFFSHNEQWEGHIRLDRVTEADLPDFAETCTSLRLTKSGGLRRCTRHHAHGDLHRDNKGREFDNASVIGYIEED